MLASHPISEEGRRHWFRLPSPPVERRAKEMRSQQPVQEKSVKKTIYSLALISSLFIVTAILATLTGLLAATAPALRAARLDPVVAIRG